MWNHIGMGLPRRTLGDDEYVVVHTRTHVKVLAGRVLWLLVLAALFGAGVAAVPDWTRPWATWLVLLLSLGLVLRGCVRPFLHWWSTTYTVTNYRIIARDGVLSRRGHDLPLARVADVRSERSVADRLLGCGTLRLATAAEPGTVVLRDIPDLARVQRALTALVLERRAVPPLDGWPSPAERPYEHA